MTGLVYSSKKIHRYRFIVPLAFRVPLITLGQRSEFCNADVRGVVTTPYYST